MIDHRPKISAIPTVETSPAKPAAPRRRSWWIWLLVAAGVLVIGYAVILRPLKQPTADRGRGTGSRTVPVTAEPAHKANLNVRILALGTVTPVSTATVRSRVDGQLQKIFFDEGRSIEAGAPLAEIDPRPYEAQKQQAEAMLAKDTTLLENARLDLDRFTVLLKQDSISKQQVDAQQSLVRQYEASLKVDQAQIDTASLQVTYAHITAPISGRTGLRLVDLGNIVHAADPGGLVVITQLRPITVVFAIPQDALPKVLKRFKSDKPMVIEAFDRDGRTLLATGKLVTIDNQIDPTTGTVKLRAEFPNDDEMLFPNQFVNVQLLAEQIEDATVVSTAAVQRGAAGNYVYIVSEQEGQKIVSVRPVETGPSERGNIVIAKGVAPGDLVVTDGVDKLREGSPVELISQSAPGVSDAKPGKTGKSGGKRSRDGAQAPQN
jgi:multidrug efflux system membrane fusion protein